MNEALAAALTALAIAAAAWIRESTDRAARRRGDKKTREQDREEGVS